MAIAPTSCADIIQMNSQAIDGDYWLYHSDGPMHLYCHNMTGTPEDYITLRNPENNYAESSNTGARTKFRRVAIDPWVGH